MRKNLRKRIGVLLLASGLAVAVSFPALAAPRKWEYDENGWWYGTNGPAGDYAVSEWQYIDGEWYYFDETGYMVTGWLDEGGARYYLKPESGAMLHSTTEVIDGVQYQFDDSGACRVIWPWKSPVVIPAESEKSETFKALDSMCDSILSGIIDDSMSQRQKAEAIYSWVRGNLRYNGRSATRDWVEEAYQGIRRRRGDCYTYFAVSQALLTRAGFPSIEVIRYTDNDHYWNLTQVDGNWYHFDTTPRSWGGTYCLLTDAQMGALSAAHYNCFAFDRSLYPPTP